MSAQHTIDTLRDTLSKLVTDWKSDGSSPPRYVREDGLGQRLTIVDTWAGGYQSPHKPVILGWQAKDNPDPATCSYHNSDGVVIVSQFPSIEAAIEYAKAKADAALASFGWNIDNPTTTEHEPAPDNGALLDELVEEFKFAVLSDEKEQANYESLGHMAREKGYPTLAHLLEPEDFPLDEEYHAKLLGKE